MGMVGLIQVGDAVPNLDQALEVKHPGRAGARMALLFEKVEQEAAAAEGGATLAAADQ